MFLMSMLINDRVSRCSGVFSVDTHLSAAAAADEEHGFSSALQESTEFKLEFSQCQHKLPDRIVNCNHSRHT